MPGAAVMKTPPSGPCILPASGSGAGANARTRRRQGRSEEVGASAGRRREAGGLRGLRRPGRRRPGRRRMEGEARRPDSRTLARLLDG
ncbi:hypothetical protein GQ55_6G006500 [Panicum hallii var. hallii]|uniref:Uncharacterized protein n=1 Tax=Panicum hallii var. hallii TaxID=1504633 RepID=A0A2T7D2N4_9POAL|nr:hypothetical protein GQ55_6G006500 [Panicum hallii var. hallii]